MLKHEETEFLFPVVVIGAGLAGLTAAVHLAERGVTPLILEASSAWPGGRLCGGDEDVFVYNGRQWSFLPDHGVHALWGGYDNMRAMLERFTDVQLQPSDGEEWINRWGRAVSTVEAGRVVTSPWIPAPFHYLQLLFRPRFWRTINLLDFLSLPGFLASIFWTVGYDPIREHSALDGLTMKEYFRGWTPNLRATFTGLGANLLAAHPDSISVTAFIAAIRFYTMLRRDSWKMQYLPGNSHDYLIQPLIDAIEERGGKLIRGATAQSLEQFEGGWRVVVEDDRLRGKRTVLARHVVLALNASAAKRLLLAGDQTFGEASGMRFPGTLRTVAVRMWFSVQPRDGASSGMFTGDFQINNFFWLHRLYGEFFDWAAAGGSAIEVHIYGTEKQLDQPEKNLLITAVNEVQSAFPELKGHFVYGVVRRNSRTHTQFRVPTRETLSVETPWAGIYACGDWIGHLTPAMWMERATTTGITAANAVLRAHHHQPFEVAKPRRPELFAWGIGGVVKVFRVLLHPLYLALRLLRGRRRVSG